jgi:diacylglycerol kinase
MIRKQSVIGAFRSAFAGLFYCIWHERNMKIHIGAIIIVAFLCWWFALEKYEIFILLLTVEGVVVAEMINTAVETIVDIVSPEIHPLAKIAKDVAAGAVMITVIFSLIIGWMLFFSKI